MDALSELMVETMRARVCTKIVAASLRGNLLHLSRACGGKSGRFSLCSLGHIVNGLEHRWTETLEL